MVGYLSDEISLLTKILHLLHQRFPFGFYYFNYIFDLLPTIFARLQLISMALNRSRCNFTSSPPLPQLFSENSIKLYLVDLQSIVCGVRNELDMFLLLRTRTLLR